MEFLDAWAEGDGDRIYRLAHNCITLTSLCLDTKFRDTKLFTFINDRCWHFLLPHFHSSGRTKYALQALRLMFQCEGMLSPQLAHHVKWDRFVNTHGGLGRNIPCDLQNEHVNRLLKRIIANMGSNLTESSLRCAARSVTTLEAVCKSFDAETGVVVGTSAHSTKPDAVDVYKVWL